MVPLFLFLWTAVIRPLYYKLTGKELEQKKGEAMSEKKEPPVADDAKVDETTLRYKIKC